MQTAAPPAELARVLRAQLATVTGGLAPDVYVNAWWDWYLNLANEPSKQLQIMQDALNKAADSWNFALKASTGQPLAGADADPRYAGNAWAQWPFNIYAHNYNNLGTNPELLEQTRAEAGQNLVRGFRHWLEDAERTFENKAPQGTENFVVGRDVAATPGKVVMRNDLVELIQYSPTTESVYAEPILLVPAWIMKYYILDLSPANSLVRYLTAQGHTVFIVSWKNPNASDRNLGMDDYLRLGIRAAIDAVANIVPDRRIHAAGYCIGGTLLSIGAALLAAEGDQRLASLTLLAAQQDFSEPGELSLFISPSQLDMLEAVMQKAGVLKSEQMGGAFAMLRARDLLWTPAVNTYLRGKRESLNDMMAWNADGTRMPCRMHTEYLRGLYLANALARGEFVAEGKQVNLTAITLPMFIIGTETDHVAPWRSVYKARALTRSSDYSFLLTSGGHNAGIVSGPVHPKRRYRMRTWNNPTDTLTPGEWFDSTPAQSGSWWPVWEQWLLRHSSEKVPARQPGSITYPALADAPGSYVLQK